MRESIGGAFLIKIMVVFLVLYNSLLAIAVNYAIAFRVKNQIINLLEQYEGCAKVGNNVQEYLSNVGYYRASGIEIHPHDDPSRGTYYTVVTKIRFDFPWINTLIEVPIKGETEIVYGVHETEQSNECGSVVNSAYR